MRYNKNIVFNKKRLILLTLLLCLTILTHFLRQSIEFKHGYIYLVCLNFWIPDPKFWDISYKHHINETHGNYTGIALHVRRKIWNDETSTEELQVQQHYHGDIEILVWTKIFEKEFGDVHSIPKHPQTLQCPIYRCKIHSDKSRIKESQVVVFHLPEYQALAEFFPKYRSLNQKWVFMSMEPAAKGLTWLTNGHLPNLTMTYRHDSDIVTPYDVIMKHPHPLEKTYRNYAEGKLNLVAWAVSNCRTHSNRNAYAAELQKHISVHVYGRCGQYTCPRTRKCNMHITNNYKFYLAFENSICKDYITEKTFAWLRRDIVPIVLGGANYKQLLPSYSYIDITDFSSPRELADYLNYLDRNDDAYNAYFEWKRYYYMPNGEGYNQIIRCGLCFGAHLYRNVSNTHNDYYNWWQSGCSERTSYYEGHVPNWQRLRKEPAPHLTNLNWPT